MLGNLWDDIAANGHEGLNQDFSHTCLHGVVEVERWRGVSSFEGGCDGCAVHDVLTIQADRRDCVGRCMAGNAGRGCVYFDWGWCDAAVVERG